MPGPSFPSPSAASRRRRLVAGAACVLAPALAGPVAAEISGKDIFGYVERVEVGKSRLELDAKLDTGADTSSLDASRIRRFRREGTRWVEFVVVDYESGRRISYKKRLLRDVRIKRHNGEHQRRPVVKMEVCLGDHLRRFEISLIDRSEFKYSMLLGRNALEGIAVVDPELSYTTEPACHEASTTE